MRSGEVVGRLADRHLVAPTKRFPADRPFSSVLPSFLLLLHQYSDCLTSCFYISHFWPPSRESDAKITHARMNYFSKPVDEEPAAKGADFRPVLAIFHTYAAQLPSNCLIAVKVCLR